jgi:hypothetical protein
VKRYNRLSRLNLEKDKTLHESGLMGLREGDAVGTSAAFSSCAVGGGCGAVGGGYCVVALVAMVMAMASRFAVTLLAMIQTVQVVCFSRKQVYAIKQVAVSQRTSVLPFVANSHHLPPS